LDESEIRQTIEKNKDDSIFQGTLNQLEIFSQLKQHLINEAGRYRSEGRADIASLIVYFMEDAQATS